MTFLTRITLAVVSALMLTQVSGETHTIIFDNRCGFGMPTLIGQNDAVLSAGGSVTVDGPLVDAIAYLQTGGCGFNGEGCTVVETTLSNEGSSTVFTACIGGVGFQYINGCDGAGADCPASDQFGPASVSCQADDESTQLRYLSVIL